MELRRSQPARRGHRESLSVESDFGVPIVVANGVSSSGGHDPRRTLVVDESLAELTGLGSLGSSVPRPGPSRQPGPSHTSPDLGARTRHQLESRRLGSIGWLMFGFSGRIDRRAFWLGMAAALGIFLAGLPWLAEAGRTGGTSGSPDTLLMVMYAVPHWMVASLVAKRWHDRGKSGWWAVTALIPVIGWIWPGCLRGTSGPNRFGEHPTGAITRGRIIGLAALIVAASLLFARGQAAYVRAPSASQFASGAPVAAPETPRVSQATARAQYQVMMETYTYDFDAIVALARTPHATDTDALVAWKRFSDATRTLTSVALALRGNALTESDIQALVVAENGILAEIPAFEHDPRSGSVQSAFRRQLILGAAAAVRVREDLGIPGPTPMVPPTA